MQNLNLSPSDLVTMAQVAKEYGVEIEYKSKEATLQMRPLLNGMELGDSSRFEPLCDSLEPIQPPLDYNESFTMKTLVEIGVGQIAYYSLIRWCDLRTVKKLAARGFITAKPPGRKISDDEIRLTDDGLVAWVALLEHRRDQKNT